MITKKLALLAMVFSLPLHAAADSKTDQDFIKCCTEIRYVGQSVKKWAKRHDQVYPPSLKALLPKYRTKAPNCPLGKPYTYRKSKSKGYILQCRAPHGKIRPEFSGKDGFPPAVAKRAKSIPKSKPKKSAYCRSNMKNLAAGIEMYSTDHNGRYPKTLNSLSPNYVYKMPECPAAGKDTYSASYRSGINPSYYRLHCQGHHHKDEGLQPNSPVRDSAKGLIWKKRR